MRELLEISKKMEQKKTSNQHTKAIFVSIFLLIFGYKMYFIIETGTKALMRTLNREHLFIEKN